MRKKIDCRTRARVWEQSRASKNGFRLNAFRGPILFLFGWLALDCLLANASSAEQFDVQSDIDATAYIAFTQTAFDQIREGYVTLEWNAVANAERYEVIDEQDTIVFSGVVTEAFLSGLSDGGYQYHVRAYDASGNVIASTKTPAQVQVDHWPMSMVALLFGVGFIVVLAVAVVLFQGARRENAEATS